MPSFDIGPTRAVGALDKRLAREPHEQAARQPQATAPKPQVAGARVAAGEPPIDADRVTEIRKAVEQGTYPIVPTKVADAMIAAGFLLRAAK